MRPPRERLHHHRVGDQHDDGRDHGDRAVGGAVERAGERRDQQRRPARTRSRARSARPGRSSGRSVREPMPRDADVDLDGVAGDDAVGWRLRVGGHPYSQPARYCVRVPTAGSTLGCDGPGRVRRRAHARVAAPGAAVAQARQVGRRGRRADDALPAHRHAPVGDPHATPPTRRSSRGCPGSCSAPAARSPAAPRSRWQAVGLLHRRLPARRLPGAPLVGAGRRRVHRAVDRADVLHRRATRTCRTCCCRRTDAQQLAEHRLRQTTTTQYPAQHFALQVWTNNALLTAQCLAAGILLLPVLYLLAAERAEHRRRRRFHDRVRPLRRVLGPDRAARAARADRVFIAAGVGLRIGWAWIAPRPGLTRTPSVAEAARSAMLVALGLVVVLGVSGADRGVRDAVAAADVRPDRHRVRGVGRRSWRTCSCSARRAQRWPSPPTWTNPCADAQRRLPGGLSVDRRRRFDGRGQELGRPPRRPSWPGRRRRPGRSSRDRRVDDLDAVRAQRADDPARSASVTVRGRGSVHVADACRGASHRLELRVVRPPRPRPCAARSSWRQHRQQALAERARLQRGEQHDQRAFAFPAQHFADDRLKSVSTSAGCSGASALTIGRAAYALVPAGDGGADGGVDGEQVDASRRRGWRARRAAARRRSPRPGGVRRPAAAVRSRSMPTRTALVRPVSSTQTTRRSRSGRQVRTTTSDRAGGGAPVDRADVVADHVLAQRVELGALAAARGSPPSRRRSRSSATFSARNRRESKRGSTRSVHGGVAAADRPTCSAGTPAAAARTSGCVTRTAGRSPRRVGRSVDRQPDAARRAVRDARSGCRRRRRGAGRRHPGVADLGAQRPRAGVRDGQRRPCAVSPRRTWRSPSRPQGDVAERRRRARGRAPTSSGDRDDRDERDPAVADGDEHGERPERRASTAARQVSTRPHRGVGTVASTESRTPSTVTPSSAASGAQPDPVPQRRADERLDVVGRDVVAAATATPTPSRSAAARSRRAGRRRVRATARRGWPGRGRRCSRAPRRRHRIRPTAARPAARSAAVATGRTPGGGQVARVEAGVVGAQHAELLVAARAAAR